MVTHSPSATATPTASFESDTRYPIPDTTTAGARGTLVRQHANKAVILTFDVFNVKRMNHKVKERGILQFEIINVTAAMMRLRVPQMHNE